MDQSPLNKLAAELRNLIYEFTLGLDEAVVLNGQDRDAGDRDHNNPYGVDPERGLKAGPASGAKTKHLLALTTTCRQIRNEGLPIFLASNHLQVRPIIPYSPLRDIFIIEPFVRVLQNWMDRLGPWASSLRSMELELSHDALLMPVSG